MEKIGILFIPDISGFTEFVNTTEIEHSQHVISELLTVLLDSNFLNLEVSEIEGDAILFYKHGDLPEIDQIYQQVELMFTQFHQHLKNYENNRICNCGACEGAPSLTLKIITHYGAFVTYQGGKFKKLIGPAVITAHKLLKNTYGGKEYWLITEQALQVLRPWQGANPSFETRVEDAGQHVKAHYHSLVKLREGVIGAPAYKSLAHKTFKQVLVRVFELNCEMHVLIQVITNLSLRDKWLVGVRRIEDSFHRINQVGNTHKCILANRCDIITTTKFEKTESSIEYGEEIEQMGILNFSLQKMGNSLTRLTITVSLFNKPFMLVMFQLALKATMRKRLDKSVLNLMQIIERKK